MNKKYSKIRTFKEISIILIGVILLFGGLGLILTAEILNAIILISIVMICFGMGIFIYILKSCYRGER